jgi:hypothetical protein
VVASGSRLLRSEFDEKTILFGLANPFLKRNAHMLRFSVGTLALFDCLCNLPIAVLQPFMKGFHALVLVGNGGDETHSCHCSEQRVGKRKGLGNLLGSFFGRGRSEATEKGTTRNTECAPLQRGKGGPFRIGMNSSDWRDVTPHVSTAKFPQTLFRRLIGDFGKSEDLVL